MRGARLAVPGELEEVLTGVQIGLPNGMAWDTAARVMYFVDSKAQTITAYPTDAGGVPLERSAAGELPRVVATVPEEDGVPDGMTIDRRALSPQRSSFGASGSLVWVSVGDRPLRAACRFSLLWLPPPLLKLRCCVHSLVLRAASLRMAPGEASEVASPRRCCSSAVAPSLAQSMPGLDHVHTYHAALSVLFTVPWLYAKADMPRRIKGKCAAL